MIGIVIVTHGKLAIEFEKALVHVVGPQENLETVCIDSDENMEAKLQEIADAIAKVEHGSGAIILTDLFGGTPSNMAISLMKDNNAEVIAGINLPMLVKLASARHNGTLAEVSDIVQEVGRKYIHVASKVLEGRE